MLKKDSWGPMMFISFLTARLCSRASLRESLISWFQIISQYNLFCVSLDRSSNNWQKLGLACSILPFALMTITPSTMLERIVSKFSRSTHEVLSCFRKSFFAESWE